MSGASQRRPLSCTRRSGGWARADVGGESMAPWRVEESCHSSAILQWSARRRKRRTALRASTVSTDARSERGMPVPRSPRPRSTQRSHSIDQENRGPISRGCGASAAGRSRRVGLPPRGGSPTAESADPWSRRLRGINSLEHRVHRPRRVPTADARIRRRKPARDLAKGMPDPAQALEIRGVAQPSIRLQVCATRRVA